MEATVAGLQSKGTARRREYNRKYYWANRGRLLAYQVEYRIKHGAKLRAASAIWRAKHSKPCPDCGKGVLYRSKRCRSCASKLSNAKFRKIYPTCLDCGGVVSRGRGVRCWNCNIKFSRTRSGHLPDNKKLQSGGYIIIRASGHPRAYKDGYVLEHIIIWEKFHDKYLPDKWHIHHLNGIKDDNRPINLVALPSYKHSLVLAEKAKRIQELEALFNNQGQLI